MASYRQVQKVTHQIVDSPLSKNTIMNQRLLKLQGQCKIKSYQFLKIQYPKAILLTILLCLTVIGLFFLKAFTQMRKYVFYTSAEPEQATQLFIIGNNYEKVITDLNKIDGQSDEFQFVYKNLSYTLSKDQNNTEMFRVIPKGFKLQLQFQKYFNNKFLNQGLSDAQVEENRQKFGYNQHIVEIQNYFQYLFDVLTAPFFILQYFFCTIYILQDLILFAIVLIAFTLITTSLNYIMLFLSFSKIKKMAERNLEIDVIRNGQYKIIKDHQLVPGDIYRPKQQIPADSILLKGNLYINQANLTGQSNPIGKFTANQITDIQKPDVWLYDGSKIITSKQNTYALVVNTGYTTIRGQIIRKIVNREVKTPAVVKSALVFVLQTIIIAFIVFFSTITVLLNISSSPSYLIFEGLDYLTAMAPLPIYFNLAYALSLRRLSNKNIIGTQPQKTVYGAKVNQIFFDKTGTITQNKVKLLQIFKIENNQFKKVTNQIHNQKIIRQLFSCCHTIQIVDDNVLGDEIDKEMDKFSKASIVPLNDQANIFMVKDGNNQLKILRLNQFSSEYRGMSVLIEDVVNKAYYVYVKGAPQMIQNKSQKTNQHIYQKTKSLSINGLRVIGMGYKKIQIRQLQTYLTNGRQQFEDNLINLGLISFENNLKQDSIDSIHEIIESGITPKMITGDNIYTALQTAKRVGMIDKFKKIVILQGYCEKSHQLNNQFYLRGKIINYQDNTQQTIKISQSEYYNSQNYAFAISHQFLTQQIDLSPKIYVFARIPPQGKSGIVKHFKQKTLQKYQQKYNSLCKRIFKPDLSMISMCGDGANDLLALKQADLSIGLQQTDASYGSSFTASNLTDIPEIIREGKTVSYNIVHIVQFYISCYFTIYLALIWLNADATYLSSQQLIFMDFGSFLWVPLFLSLAQSSGLNVNTTPSINFMTLYNHLVTWGSTLIMYGAFIGGYLFFYQSEDFERNEDQQITDDSGFHPYNHSMTMIFLLILIFIPIMGLALTRSKPWNKRIYKNIVLTIFLLINFISAIIFIFINKQLVEAFKLKQFPIIYAGTGTAFILAGGIVLIFYNQLIDSFKMNQQEINAIQNK